MIERYLPFAESGVRHITRHNLSGQPVKVHDDYVSKSCFYRFFIDAGLHSFLFYLFCLQ